MLLVRKSVMLTIYSRWHRRSGYPHAFRQCSPFPIARVFDQRSRLTYSSSLFIKALVILLGSFGGGIFAFSVAMTLKGLRPTSMNKTFPSRRANSPIRWPEREYRGGVTTSAFKESD